MAAEGSATATRGPGAPLQAAGAFFRPLAAAAAIGAIRRNGEDVRWHGEFAAAIVALKEERAKLGSVTSLMASAQGENERASEIRLALVMNGGVSLAVWMGGVTHELDLLCRASNGEQPPEDMNAAEKRVFTIWAELTAGVRFKVDIISGTSAGGLNGLLLATAIARGAPMPDLRKLWRATASLEGLKPSTSRRRQERSVLSGKAFEEKISKALDDIPEMDGTGPSNEPVTLFVTATALDGSPLRFKDGFDRGGPESQFDVWDHRRVYCFRNQQHADKYEYSPEKGKWGLGDKNIEDFSKTNHAALLRAARATASFPGAFEPVSEEPLVNFLEKPERSESRDYETSCLMDGGVLNNAPFGPVLEEITKRRVRDVVDAGRILIYVVPSSGRPAGRGTKKQQCQSISPGAAAWKALQYPQEVDFRTGTEDLKQRLQSSFRETRMELFERMIHLEGTADAKLEAARDLEERMRASAEQLLGEYRHSRVKAVVLEVLDDAKESEAVTVLATPDQVAAESIDRILLDEHDWFPPLEAVALRAPDLSAWRWGMIPAERILQTLYSHLHEILRSNTPHRVAIADAARDIYDQVVKIIAINDAARAEEKRRHWSGGEMGAVRAAWLVQEVFADLKVPHEVGVLVTVAAEKYLDAVKLVSAPGVRWETPQQVVSTLLVGEVLTKALAPPAKVLGKLTPEFRFLRLGPDAMGPLFKDELDLGDQKLYGIRFRHFGAFIDEDWRRSDFAWGRLDAAHHLLPLLPKNHRSEQDERKLHEAILAAELPREANGDPVTAMRENLDELAESSAGDLLGSGRAKALKPIGDSVLRLLTSNNKWPTRVAARAVWTVVRRRALRALDHR